MKQFARRRHSSVLGDGPKQERWKTWARVLPSSGRHLIASFDSAIVFGYLNCNPVTASKLLSIDRHHLGDENMFGPTGSRIHLHLDFITAAYCGELKPSQERTTVAICILRPFLDLLLRKAVRNTNLATASANNPSDEIRTRSKTSQNIDYCGIDWQSARDYNGASLQHGCQLVSLVVGGGWLRRLLTVDDGLFCVVQQHEMGRFFNQNYQHHQQLVVPKQRHYQPDPPCPPHPRTMGGASDIKWSNPNWAQRETQREQETSDSNDQTNNALNTSRISAWDNDKRFETKRSHDTIDQLGLCDMCYLFDSKFDRDRHKILQRAYKSGVRHIVVLPSGNLVECERAIQFCNATMDTPSAESSKDTDVQADVAQVPANMVVSTVAGVHPDDARSWGSDRRIELKQLLSSSSICAVGVIGLDFHRMLSSEAYQRICFQDQLCLCKEMNLTAIVTEKWAMEECVGVLTNPLYAPDRLLVVGCEGTAEQLRAYLDIGAYIGLSGQVARDKGTGKRLRALLRQGVIPLERICIYSGAPFHYPGNSRQRGAQEDDTLGRGVGQHNVWKRNEPKYLSKICNTVAKCLGRAVDEVVFCTTLNHTFLFRNDQVKEIFGDGTNI
jgi:TatD DNase family protein